MGQGAERYAAAGLVLIALAALWLGCAGLVRAMRAPTADPVVAATPHVHGASGMTLREAFETFPRTDDAPARLRLLVENDDAWTERWRLLANSERSLDITYFVLHEDVFGVAFLGHLLEKARQGIRIRILLDAFGTDMSRASRGEDYLDELANTDSASVRMFRPSWIRYVEALLSFDPTVAFASEHDKIIVADGRHGLIGGRNIGSEYFAAPGSRSQVFHDTDLRIDGAAVAGALTRAFEAQYASDHAKEAAGEAFNLVSRESELLGAYRAMDAWLRASPGARNGRIDSSGRAGGVDESATPWQAELEKLPGLRGALHRAPARTFTADTRILDSQVRPGGRSADDPITAALMRLVGSARETVLFQSPYLVLSEEAVEILARAGRRGVAITVLTNSPVSSDNALSQAFFLEQWPEILARVPGMRLFVGGRGRTLHDKAAVFDDRLALVGTYNLDPMSMAMNSEVVAAVWSLDFARAVAAEPRRIIAAGSPAVYEYTIRRDAAGGPLRDSDGQARIAFGPEDHCEPEQWTALAAYWTALRAIDEFTGLSALF